MAQMDILDFYHKHKGETGLLVGNGINLHLTPPEWFDYPSIGMNTIYKYEGWQPNYFIAVDPRLMREDGKQIAEKYKDVPKFVASPGLDNWQGENFYRFIGKPSKVIPVSTSDASQRDFLVSGNIRWNCVMTAAMQLGWWLGFETLLMIGVHHDTNDQQAHFWGQDVKAPIKDLSILYEAKRTVVRMANGVRFLNISEDTHVPEDVLPRGDWRDWRNT